jgi:hypothetical protein
MVLHYYLVLSFRATRGKRVQTKASCFRATRGNSFSPDEIMSGAIISTYRLPTASATKIGSVRVVKDRHGKVYADGQKVVSANTAGEHTVLEIADGRNFYVLTADLQRVPKAKAR